MPVYEYFCKSCEDTFEELRPMGQMTAVATCPEGHDGAQKVLSMFASVSKAEGCMSPSSMPTSGCGAGACCMN